MKIFRHDDAGNFPPVIISAASLIFRAGKLWWGEVFIRGATFSTFSTTSHHSHRGALRTGCCRLLRREGIIATNRSHKLKSFHGIFYPSSRHSITPRFSTYPRMKGKSYSRRTSETGKNTQRRISKGGVYEKLSFGRTALRKKQFLMFIFCLAF